MYMWCGMLVYLYSLLYTHTEIDIYIYVYRYHVDIHINTWVAGPRLATCYYVWQAQMVTRMRCSDSGKMTGFLQKRQVINVFWWSKKSKLRKKSAWSLRHQAAPRNGKWCGYDLSRQQQRGKFRQLCINIYINIYIYKYINIHIYKKKMNIYIYINIYI